MNEDDFEGIEALNDADDAAYMAAMDAEERTGVHDEINEETD